MSDTWQTRAPLPNGRERLAAVTLIDRIYALGGLGDGPTVSARVEVYDPLTDTWQSDTPMPTARAGLGAVASGDRLYAIGGWAIAYTTFRTVEAATFLHEHAWLPFATGAAWP